jgi:ferric-dicitrate binding protein FerR (iron transport regulator)
MKKQPHDWSYKLKVHKFTPEEEAILQRWREEARQKAYERLRERDVR